MSPAFGNDFRDRQYATGEPRTNGVFWSDDRGSAQSERASQISSVESFWNYLKLVLENL
jgi:hypothetical protein